MLLEVMLALTIASFAALVLSHGFTVSRRAASTVGARAAALQARVRAVNGLCRCADGRGRPALLSLGLHRSPDDPIEALIRSSTIRHRGETLMLVCFPPGEQWWVACGVPGTKRWEP